MQSKTRKRSKHSEDLCQAGRKDLPFQNSTNLTRPHVGHSPEVCTARGVQGLWLHLLNARQARTEVPCVQEDGRVGAAGQGPQGKHLGALCARRVSGFSPGAFVVIATYSTANQQLLQGVLLLLPISCSCCGRGRTPGVQTCTHVMHLRFQTGHEIQHILESEASSGRCQWHAAAGEALHRGTQITFCAASTGLSRVTSLATCWVMYLQPSGHCTLANLLATCCI